MPTAARVPLDVYLCSEYEPDAEYVDGEIEERPMGEDDHSAWQLAISFWFRQNASKWNIRVRPELRVQTSPTRFRVPDVAIIDAAQPREQIATHPPIAVLEVLSPEDTLRKLTRKLKDYAGMGIGEIWVVDPADGIWLRFEEGQLIRRVRLCVPGNIIDFQLDEISRLVE